jgi:enoyl-CoA hydratase/carnithine racemase
VTTGSEAPDGNWVVDRDDEVAVLRYASGQRRTMGIDQAGQLGALIAERAGRADPPVLVLVVDVLHAELAEVRQMSQGRPIGDWAPWVGAIDGLEHYPSATIAAVPLQATCGGLELTLAADLRVASPTARLGVLETRMGLLPGAGGTQRLPELIGHGNAALLVLTGEAVSGTEAHRMGLVQLIDVDPVAHAIALAERLAAIGPIVLAAAKRALAAGRTRNADGFRTEGRGFLSLVNLDSTKARVDAWLAAQSENRNPALDPSP